MRKAWTIIFLIITAAGLGMELWAGLDTNPTTVPWTELISGYVPQPITLTAISVLAAWLPVHFAHHYVGKTPPDRYTKTLVPALTAGLTALGAALTDDTVTRPELLAIMSIIATGLGVYAVPNAKQPPRDEAVAFLRAQEKTPPRR